MNDDTPWEQPSFVPPTSEAPAPRQRRKKAEDKPARQPRKAREPEAATPAPARKPRKPREERPAPETIKVTLKEFAIMRVGEENAKAFLKAHTLLGDLAKGARSKVLVELAKVLG